MASRVLLLTLVLLGAAGCGAPGWHTAGATSQDFSADSDACQQEARRNGSYALLAGPLRMRETQDRCLQSRGWTVSHR